ncbi:MAG TPA: MFS transporter [Candidatus Sulfotelmatobacter sp.]|nr:MFS transporter [Candidatus Sulfotelmatobacter sp.]
MSTVMDTLRGLTTAQRNTFVASFLAWTFDAFDFFVLVFILRPLAQDFGSSVKDLTFAIVLTLAARPVGALIFGRLADRYGRRPVLMINILCYSVIELASAFAPSLPVMLALRTLYGVAMGGMWGVAASLTFEVIPLQARGLVSGILQQGYAVGYLIAAAIFALLFPSIGWRGMFVVGTIPVLLIPFIWLCVPESPIWRETAKQKHDLLGAITANWRTVIFMIVLMTAFNFLSHGTQDLYPTFLEAQRHLPTETVGVIAIIYNIGAIIGGTTFGALSQRIGRRRTIVLAALLVLPIIPVWAFSSSVLWLTVGAFLLQIMVQGAWGVVPVHLNELSPEGVRGTLPGFVYQLGNLFAAVNATLQATIAESHGGDYAIGLALVAGVTAVVVAVIAGSGKEAKDVRFGVARAVA